MAERAGAEPLADHHRDAPARANPRAAGGLHRHRRGDARGALLRPRLVAGGACLSAGARHAAARAGAARAGAAVRGPHLWWSAVPARLRAGAHHGLPGRHAVGRPIRQLAEEARRIAEGELASPASSPPRTRCGPCPPPSPDAGATGGGARPAAARGLQIGTTTEQIVATSARATRPARPSRPARSTRRAPPPRSWPAQRAADRRERRARWRTSPSGRFAAAQGGPAQRRGLPHRHGAHEARTTRPSPTR